MPCLVKQHSVRWAGDLLNRRCVGGVARQGTADYLTGAITLAALSGVMLLGFGLLRLGFWQFLSHTVVSAFIDVRSSH